MFQPQSDEYVCQPINGSVTMGMVNPVTENQYLVHFGEQVVSLRSILHRYSRVTTESFSPSTVSNTFQYVEKIVARLPLTPGYISTGYSVANKQVSGTANYNYCSMTPLSWISNMFLCYRGGVNYTFNVGNSTPIKDVHVFRGYNVQAELVVDSVVIASSSQFNRAAISISGSRGSAITNQLTQSGINVMFPMFSHYKFLSTDPSKGNVPGAEDPDMLSLKMSLPYPTTTITDDIVVNTYVASAPDFSLHFFVNIPSLFVYANYPTAV
jgi:hypothetical protein